MSQYFEEIITKIEILFILYKNILKLIINYAQITNTIFIKTEISYFLTETQNHFLFLSSIL